MKLLLLLLPLSVAVASHPTFKLLDSAGQPVVKSGQAHSFVQSCNSCHDVDYIKTHSSHPRDGSLVGNMDKGTALLYGAGSGIESETPDCFLCHIENSTPQLRASTLTSEAPEKANLATLASTSLVEHGSTNWNWVRNQLPANGDWPLDLVPMKDLNQESCGYCHGFADSRGAAQLLEAPALDEHSWAWQGVLYESQRLHESDLNLRSKATLSRPWDVHAQALLGCSSCHHSADNPVHRQRDRNLTPDHLQYEPRRLPVADWMTRPSHVLVAAPARGQQSSRESHTMRQCVDCHRAEFAHDWLPYRDSHMNALSCTACHISSLPAGALYSVDYSVPDLEGRVQSTWRGAASSPNNTAELQTGARPILLPQIQEEDHWKLTPVNLVTHLRWKTESGGFVIPLDTLIGLMRAVNLDPATMDRESALARISQLLKKGGYPNALREADLKVYPLQHGITSGKFALRDCKECHSPEAGAMQMRLADVGDGMKPLLWKNTEAGIWPPELEHKNGVLKVRTSLAPLSAPYLPGSTRATLSDKLGLLIFLVTGAGVLGHSFLRWQAHRRQKRGM